MKKVLLIIFLFIGVFSYSQNRPSRVDLLKFDVLTTAQMNAIPSSEIDEGDYIDNTDTETLWRYNGSIWVDTGAGGIADGDNQQLTRSGNTLTLEDGGSVDLSDLGGGTSTQLSQSEVVGFVDAQYPNLDTDNTDDVVKGQDNVNASGTKLISDIGSFEIGIGNTSAYIADDIESNGISISKNSASMEFGSGSIRLSSNGTTVQAVDSLLITVRDDANNNNGTQQRFDFDAIFDTDNDIVRKINLDAALSGLSGFDDSGLLPLDGSRAMSGNLNVGNKELRKIRFARFSDFTNTDRVFIGMPSNDEFTITPEVGSEINYDFPSQKWSIGGNAPTIDALAGTGDRMLVANATGELSTQAIPSGGGGTSTPTNLSLNGNVIENSNGTGVDLSGIIPEVENTTPNASNTNPELYNYGGASYMAPYNGTNTDIPPPWVPDAGLTVSVAANDENTDFFGDYVLQLTGSGFYRLFIPLNGLARNLDVNIRARAVNGSYRVRELAGDPNQAFLTLPLSNTEWEVLEIPIFWDPANYATGVVLAVNPETASSIVQIQMSVKDEK